MSQSARDECIYAEGLIRILTVRMRWKRGSLHAAVPAISRSTISRAGMLVIAPRVCTASDAAAVAKRNDAPTSRPSAHATANAAVKQSPAPVVSTTCATGNAACHSGSRPSAPTRMQPRAPSFTTTSLIMPPASSARAAASTRASSSVGRPVMRASSVSFGLTLVHSASSSLETALSSPPTSSTTGTPLARASVAAAMLTRSGISR
mmetsp:Transcript_8544/g.26915  ORF Transcript_8544/g.26915 Transcript_8544/m.26915 type:complete len:206 (+) Transcript_8544:594-1211(+)